MRIIEDSLISVIVPVYNVADYLDDCLQSIVNQDYSNLEIILINDGSTDDSGALCLKWASKDSRIRYVSQENRGLSAARNRGVELATGEFASFIDSDDTVEPDFISSLYSAMKAVNADIAVGNYEGVGHPLILDDIPDRISQGEAMNLLCLGKLPVAVWGRLYRIGLLKITPFIEGLLFEDMPFSFEILPKCDSVAICDKTLYHYRSRKDSITQTASKKNLSDWNKAMDLVAEKIGDYYSPSDFRVFEWEIVHYVALESDFQERYKKLLNPQERADLREKQRVLRRKILTGLNPKDRPKLSPNVRLRLLAIKYMPFLCHHLYKIGRALKEKDLQRRNDVISKGKP